MKSYEAMKESAGEQRDSMISEIAHRLHISNSLAYKWTQPCECPTESGARSPLDVLKQWMESCLILGRPKAAALAPLHNLNQHFGFVSFPVPDRVKALSSESLSNEIIRCMKESGDVVRTYQEAMADGRISKQDLKALEREVWEAVTELVVFLHCAKEAKR